MPKPSLQAAAEGLPAISRRSFLRSTAGASVATIATGTVATAAQAIPDDKSSAIDALLTDYLAEKRRGRVLSAEYTRAVASLPAWANIGPSLMNPDGTKGGPVTGWPEVAVLPTPDPERPAVHHLIRPAVSDVWKRARSTIYDGPLAVRHDDGTITVKNLPPVIGQKRRAARLSGYQKVREVIARQRQQHEEKIKVGLPRIEAEIDAASDRRHTIEDRIRELASGISPAEIAAIALFEFYHDGEDFALSLLERTAPHLSGLLRVLVLDMIAVGPDDALRSMLHRGQTPKKVGV